MEKTKNKVVKKSINSHANNSIGTPFDDVYRTLLEKCTSLMIPVINEIFKTNYSYDEEVVVLSNEHYVLEGDGKEVKRITDSHLLIAGKKYHIECQSSEDSIMEIRMIEYDFSIALSEMKNLKNEKEKPQKLVFPHSAVIVVRDLDKISDNLEITISVPSYKDNSVTYNEILYSVPIVKITDYSKEEIFEKDLIFFIPYYIMKFEKRLKEINENTDELNELMEDYRDIYDRLVALSDNNRFNRKYLRDLISLISKLINVVARNADNVKERLDVMGGQVLELESDKMIEEAEARGEARGITFGENRYSKLMSLLLKDQLYDEIEKVTKNDEYRKELYHKYNI